MKNYKIIEQLKKIPGFDKVKFIFLFGSVVFNKQNKFSDIDIAIFYDGDEKERFEFRKKALGNLPEKYDLQIFQDLPVYLRINILKGKVIYCPNKDFLYFIAYETIKQFGSLKKYLNDYITRRKELWEKI